MKLIDMKVNVFEDGSYFTACCPKFGVFSQGGDEVEAFVNLMEAIGLFVQTCGDQGTAHIVLGLDKDGN